MALARGRLTLEEFLRLPEEKPALEYLDGAVSQKVSPNVWHGILQGVLTEEINLIARRRRIALALPEVRETYAGKSSVPDISVYRWDHIPHGSDGKALTESRLPPDIAIEILSPGQSAVELYERCRWYVSNGVEIALLIHPRDLIVVAFRVGGSEEWSAHTRIDIDSVVPGFQLTVDELFATLQVGPARE
jgi:Uma2 family endonuclease